MNTLARIQTTCSYGKKLPDPSTLPNTASGLLRICRNMDVRLWVEGDGIKWDAPVGTVTPALLSALSRHKPELLQILPGTLPARKGEPFRFSGDDPHSEPANPTNPAYDPYAIEERAALMTESDPDPSAYGRALVLIRARHVPGADLPPIVTDDPFDPFNVLAARGLA